MKAQYCSNAADTIYSLTASGRICPINVNTAGGAPAPNRDSTGNGINANGLGFSSLNGSFYFFNHCNYVGAAGGDSIQFVRYVPSTRTTVVLADPPSTFTVTDKIRSGCVNNSGTGYYTIDPAAAGGAALYYYSIGSNTWTTVTQTFKNRSGVTIANIVSLNSGDMAFDGTGNLWIVCSSSANWTMYKITAPLPTTVTANLVVDTIISQRATPNAASFTGVAFNSAGKLYLSTGAGTNPGNNKLYELTTASGTLTLKGTLLAGYGDDLTSCSFPPGVLANVWVNFTGVFQNNAIQLAWSVNEKENVSGYNVEFSTDAEHWRAIAHVEKDYTATGSLKTYRYNHQEFNTGGNYYRIVQVSATGEQVNSSIKFVNTGDGKKIYIGPNPATDIIYIYNRSNNYKQIARVCDKDGRIVYSTILLPDQPSINIGHLPTGVYVLKLFTSAVDEAPVSYRFIKW